MSGAEKLFGPETAPTPTEGTPAKKLSLGKFGKWDHKHTILACGAVVAIGAGLYSRHQHATTGTTAPGASSPSAAVQGAAAQQAAGSGTYDSSPSDVYNSIEPLLEQFQGIANQFNGTPKAVTPPNPTQTPRPFGGVHHYVNGKFVWGPAPKTTTPTPRPDGGVHHYVNGKWVWGPGPSTKAPTPAPKPTPPHPTPNPPPVKKPAPPKKKPPYGPIGLPFKTGRPGLDPTAGKPKAP